MFGQVLLLQRCLSLIQFLDNRSNGHKYFSLRTQERRVQDECRGQDSHGQSSTVSS
jgi:hypothetical protein